MKLTFSMFLSRIALQLHISWSWKPMRFNSKSPQAANNAADQQKFENLQNKVQLLLSKFEYPMIFWIMASRLAVGSHHHIPVLIVSASQFLQALDLRPSIRWYWILGMRHIPSSGVTISRRLVVFLAIKLKPYRKAIKNPGWRSVLDWILQSYQSPKSINFGFVPPLSMLLQLWLHECHVFSPVTYL